MSLRILDISNPLEVSITASNHEINLIYQFFIPDNKRRYDELKECLNHNVNNKYVNNIYLLNEDFYSASELGVDDLVKISQFNVGKRLTFADTFKFINDHDIQGYNVIINSDIFIDDTICRLNQTNLHESKILLAQLRHNFISQTPLSSAKLYGPRYDSQDAWILHSNHNIPEKYHSMFNFKFGVPGCDNKILYLFKMLGYSIQNDPLTIKIYHLHKDITRNYEKHILPPWGLIMPAHINILDNMSSLGIDVKTSYNLSNRFNNFSFTNDCNKFKTYVTYKLSNNSRFIIPCIGGIENNVAIIGSNTTLHDSDSQYLITIFSEMKNTLGIQLTNRKSINNYSNQYLKAFEDCDMYGGWEPWGSEYNKIKKSHDSIRTLYTTKQILWARVFDIYNYIQSNPWTLALKGKRILIISLFADEMREKDNNRDKIYGIDLFPECKIMYIKPPHTHGDMSSHVFTEELREFNRHLDAISGNYDVALVSAKGYGNLICSHIYDTLHSAINIGDVLQMYFGIIYQENMIKYADVLRCYINIHWTRVTN
jgi:hypothetical protein